MPSKNPKRLDISRARKRTETVRLRAREIRLREGLGPFISEANLWRASVTNAVERLEPFILRNATGEISFKKGIKPEQVETAARVAKTFLEKYGALNKAYQEHRRIAKVAGIEPAFYGEQLSPIRSGVELGEGIKLASVEASRLLNAAEQAKKAK